MQVIIKGFIVLRIDISSDCKAVLIPCWNRIISKNLKPLFWHWTKTF